MQIVHVYFYKLDRTSAVVHFYFSGTIILSQCNIIDDIIINRISKRSIEIHQSTKLNDVGNEIRYIGITGHEIGKFDQKVPLWKWQNEWDAIILGWTFRICLKAMLGISIIPNHRNR